MQNLLKKEYNKFRKKSWFGKFTDLLFLLMVVFLLIPSARKELMTYGSKLRMYLTSVKPKEESSELQGENSLIFHDRQGNQYELADFLDQPVYINYWATWCPPCRAEMPTIEKLYTQYREDVHFLMLSAEPLGQQNAFLSEKNYDLPYYRLISRPSGSLSYSVLPTSLVISKDNKVVLRKEGAVNWQSKKVRRIFNNLQ